ncbi:Pkinase-domain-containing protein [Neurospora tetraspora]|uniref:Autophagy-related protein 1 n=1 Tax=Neurospora tetraspora TaxID=94610 RepID=A0AAE0J1B0_9PEZI|nr:Pkinase-domain-containing protein [Neurospora tetraspora]
MKVVTRMVDVAPAFVMERNDTNQIHMDFGNDHENTSVRAPAEPSELHLAFRFSSELKNPLEGFVFGRGHEVCDVSVSPKLKSVSNKHFKICFNEHGILMIEDLSFNGTNVNGKWIYSARKPREGEHPKMWTLGSGSVIRILGAQPGKSEEVKREEDIVFLVRVPNRHGRHAEAYKDNLVKYLLQRTEVDVNKTIVPGPGGRVDLFRDSPQKPTVRAPVIAMRQLSPSSMLGSCGMRTWKGSDKYNFVDKIGQGAFATVYMITDKMNGRPYAAKELEKRRFMKNGVLDQKVENEMKIMQRVSHPNIVQFKEHLDPDDKHLYIIMEFVGEGDLGKYIGAKGPFSEPDTKTIARQLVDALGYLHDMNITHRDVKPDNILIQSRFPLVVKLTDFGLSKMIDHDATFLRTFCGTLLYCAPEVYAEFEEYDEFGRRNVPRSYPRQPRRSQRYDHNVDIWSLGGVLYFALTTQPPFPARNGVGHTEFLHQVMTTVPNLAPLIEAEVSPECQDFLGQMLRRRPENRATAQELLNHEWIHTSQDPSNVAPSCPQNGGVDELLEAGASQLSLTDRPAATPRGDAQGDVNVASEDNLLQQELIDDEEHVSDFEQDKENYAYRPATQNGRLYGEVGQSALGSQGDVASGRLNLPATPISVETPKLFRSKDEIPDSQDNSEDEEDTPRQSNPHTQRSQPLLGDSSYFTSSDASRSVDVVNNTILGANSQSLEGAESIMGPLNMQSRHGLAIPSVGTDLNRSKRKSFFATNTTNSWSSIENEPVSKKRRSNRGVGAILNRKIAPIENEDELLAQVPMIRSYPKVTPPAPEPQIKSVYWDNKNLSTCHLNYPEMTVAQWNAFRIAAENRKKRDGSNEKFEPGKSPLWALAEKYFPPMSKIETDQPLLWALAKESGVVTETSQRKSMAISEGGCLRSSYESILPCISIRLSKSIVTWGRSSENTERYPDEHEHATRIPECALKIMVWREKNFDPSNRLMPWIQYYGDNEDLYFYVATKATDGIYVNGKHLASNEPSDRKSICKNWMRLYNGDRIIVWNDPKDDGTLSKIEVVFECNWGGSRFSRESSEHKTPELVSEEVAKKLDEVCVDAERKAKKYHPLHEMYPPDTADSEERKARIGWEEKLSRNFQRQVEEAKKAMPLVAKGTNSRYSGSYSFSSSSSSGSRQSWGDLGI